MPRFDGTGPLGEGSATGGGFCNCIPGLRWERGRRAGRGLGRYFYGSRSLTKKEREEALAEYKKALEEELEDVKKEEKDLSSKE